MGMINTEFSVVVILAGYQGCLRGAEGVWVILILLIKLCFLSLVVDTWMFVPFFFVLCTLYVIYLLLRE